MLEGAGIRALPDEDDEHRRGQPTCPAVAQQGRTGAAGERQGDSRLLLVREPADVRQQPRTDVLGQGSQRLAAGVERRKQPRGIPLGGGAASDPERCLGDDAERALAADDNVEQARARRRGRAAPSEHELASRRREPQAEHDVVDAAVARRRLTGGARGDVAAERRLLVALGVVPERQAVRLEGPLDVGAAQPRLEGRETGILIDVEQLIHPSQVDGDHAGERALPAAGGPHAAHDARATTEGHDRDALGAAHLEEPLHLPRVSRLDDGVGRLRPVATPQPPQVGVALAPCMLDPPPVIGVHEGVADDVTQRGQLRVAEGDRGQQDLLERDRRRRRATRDAERPRASTTRPRSGGAPRPGHPSRATPSAGSIGSAHP